MEENIQEYLLKVYSGTLNSKCALAIHKLSDEFGESFIPNQVFISNRSENGACIFDDNTLWLFTEKKIIRCADYSTGEEYKVIPINSISNITLKFNDINLTSIEFKYINEQFVLSASGFNKDYLSSIYKYFTSK